MPSCCRGNACTGRACVSVVGIQSGFDELDAFERPMVGDGTGGAAQAMCLPHPSGPSPGQTHRGPLPARGRVRGDALSTCMDCGLVSGACLWLSYIRRTASRRRPGVGNRRWSIPCTSIPHIGKKCPACPGYVSREGPPAGHPRFMGYRHNGCRRHGRRPSMRRLQGLLVAPCRTATVISIGKRKAPDPSGMVQVLLQITRTHPLGASRVSTSSA